VVIEPGCPWQRPFVESFRDELLKLRAVRPPGRSAVVIDDWREDDNTRRPHSALGMRTPAAFAAQ